MQPSASLGLASERLNAGRVFRVISAGVFRSCVKGGGGGDVEVMDLFMLCVPSIAARYEGRSYGCLYITLRDLQRARQPEGC